MKNFFKILIKKKMIKIYKKINNPLILNLNKKTKVFKENPSS